MESKHLILISVLAVAGCGGGGSSSPPVNPQSVPSRALAPQNVTASVGDTDMMIDWDSVEGATSYNVYHSTQKGLDPANYAAFEGGTWVQNVTPPVSVPISNMSAVYHFVVSANVDSTEGEYSPPTIAVPRYVSAATPGWVEDRATNFEWDRCPHGQNYNAANHTCDGAATRLGFLEAREAAHDEGAEVPVADFISTITFCSSGEPSYFPGEQGCTASSAEPAAYEGAFPHSETETSMYITATYCTVNTLRLFSYGGGHPSGCAGPPDALFVNLRLMRRP